jgi:hypothetical protein
MSESKLKVTRTLVINVDPHHLLADWFSELREHCEEDEPINDTLISAYKINDDLDSGWRTKLPKKTLSKVTELLIPKVLTDFFADYLITGENEPPCVQ